MKISTKGRYGLRAMVDLAVNSNGQLITLNSIAERQNISERYLEQLFSTLKKSGLIKSEKGSQGGYMLSKSASKITAGDILRVLEGSLSVIGDVEYEKDNAPDMEKFLISNVWEKINENISKVIDSITLEELAVNYKKYYEQTSFMFYI